MASGKDLTRLATLAGMAYIANKMGDKDKGDSGSMRAARPESTETRAAPEAPTADESTKSDVLKAITAKRKAPNDQADSEGVISTPTPAKPKRVIDNTTASKYPGGVTPSPAEMRESLTKKAAQADFPNMQRTFTIGDEPDVEKQKRYDAITEKSGAITPSALKTDAMKVASRAAAAADRQRRMARTGGMKKGGSVKKMASGGMTASKRADGIASRGKTKCKMY